MERKNIHIFSPIIEELSNQSKDIRTRIMNTKDINVLKR